MVTVPLRRACFLSCRSRLALSLALSSCWFLPIPAAAVEPTTGVNPYSAFWTGSLISGSGHTVPAGHAALSPVLAYAIPLKADATPRLSPMMVATAGLTSALDIQVLLRTAYQAQGGITRMQLGDTSARLAFQLLEDQRDGGAAPDVMFFALQTFPTGRYQELDPAQGGAFASGSGAYTTALGVNAQKVFLPSNRHPLRLRLNLGFQFPSSVAVRGPSMYGGDERTVGNIYPAMGVSALVGAELHLSRRWVIAQDVAYSSVGADTFVKGSAPVSAGPLAAIDAVAAPVGRAGVDRLGFASGVEYCFNENLGVIGGLSVDVGRGVTTTLSPMFSASIFY